MGNWDSAGVVFDELCYPVYIYIYIYVYPTYSAHNLFTRNIVTYRYM